MGTETIHVATVKKQDVLGLPALITDIYHISEIDDVTVNKDDEFTIKYDRGTSSVTFSSSRCQDIVRAIETSKVSFLFLLLFPSLSESFLSFVDVHRQGSSSPSQQEMCR